MKTSFSFKLGYLNFPIPCDFSIFVDQKEHMFHLSRLIAFSPKINSLILSDPTIKRIDYPFSDSIGQFSLIHKLVAGEKIPINKTNIQFLTEAASFFENLELLREVSLYYIENSEAKMLKRIEEQPNKYPLVFIENELNFIAENFDKYSSNNVIKNLSLEQYEALFNSLKFNTQSTEDLFEFICELVDERGHEYSSLFSCLYFDELSPYEMEKLLDKIKIEEVNGSLWHSIIPRLKKKLFNENATEKINNQKVSSYTTITELPDQYKIISKYFDFNKDNKLDGIFNFFSKIGNPEYNKFIKLTGGGTKMRFANYVFYSEGPYDFVWNNFDAKEKKCKEDDQWLCVELLFYKVKLTAYTIAVGYEKKNYTQPREWNLLGSTDGQNWTLIDHRYDCFAMNQPMAIERFVVNKQDKYYSYFKFVQEANFSNPQQSERRFMFSLSKVEFFGEVQKR